MTIYEIIYNIKNIGSGGIQSSDDWKKLSLRQLEFIVNYVRALLIKRDVDKGRSINPDIEQDLGCVKLIQVDPAECCEIDTECIVLRTENPIPRPLEINDRDLITYVGRVDKTYSFPLVHTARVRWIKFNKYTSKLRLAYYLNGYIYITNDTDIETINIRGVFENPRDVKSYNDCTSGNCYDPNKDKYPIAAWMIQPLTQIILSGELSISKSIPLDTTNDTEPITLVK